MRSLRLLYYELTNIITSCSAFIAALSALFEGGRYPSDKSRLEKSKSSRFLLVRPACIQSNRCKSSARPIAGSAQPKTRVSVARPNLKEVGGKRLA